MTWGFQTEPEFQRELDWIDEFVREEVEPLDRVLGAAADIHDPLFQKLVRPLQKQVQARGFWACHLGPELGGRGYGQLKLAMPKVLNDIASRALQIHGSLGITDQMPFADMLMNSFQVALADGPTEVHKVTVAKEVLKDAAPATGTFPSYIGYEKDARARAKFGDVLEKETA